jgi:hypothetical protein
MSVSLFVKLNRPTPFDDIENNTSSSLRELLNLDYNPSVTASFDLGDRRKRVGRVVQLNKTPI